MKVSAKQYGQALYKILRGRRGASIEQILKEFASLLFHHGETSKLREIIRHYDTVQLQEEGKIRVHRVSAYTGSDILPRKMFGKGVIEESREDKTLYAGLRVRIGDTLLDNSVASRLKNLKNALN